MKTLKRLVTRQLLSDVLPFALIQLFVWIMCRNITCYSWTVVFPNVLFTVLWISFFVLFSKSLGKVAGRIVYTLFVMLTFALFVTNCIYFSLTGSFFGFHLALMAKEGSSYILYTALHASPFAYCAIAIVLAFCIYSAIKFRPDEKISFVRPLVFLAAFAVIHACIPLLFGSANTKLKWNNFKNARNVYDSFYDKDKAMKSCGLFEYGARDFYLTFIKAPDEEDPDELSYLQNCYKTATPHMANDYTGVFVGKNVIFLQLEGIDLWLTDEKTMPNLHSLMKASVEFKNHFSYYNGGGSTFNSELAVNTGFITPITYTRNSYTFSSNYFPYSLPNVLKDRGYAVSAFHMNTGDFYSRRINYLNWGYDFYHGLIDECKYKDKSFELDRELVLNDKFHDLIFKGKQPFMHYIITYTPHTPFDGTNDAAKLLTAEKYGKDVPQMGEEDYARLMASETDNMIGLLLDGLRENNLLENTVIVGFTDHYLYTLNDKSILAKYKTTENNLINQTPFFIWSEALSHTEVEKTNSQLDILPTVLNMLGVQYNDESYIGNDVFSKDYEGYAFFPDISMYDGKTYTENADLPQIQKNDLTLKYDYFERLK